MDNPQVTTDQQTVNIEIPVDEFSTPNPQVEATNSQAVNQVLGQAQQPELVNPNPSEHTVRKLDQSFAKCACQKGADHEEELPQAQTEQKNDTSIAVEQFWQEASKIEEKPKHAGGRPCELCKHLEEYQEKLKQYINECRGTEDKKPKTPYIQEFADMLDVDKETIIDWSDKINEETKELEHPEFHRLQKVAENLQELRLNQRLMGRYNPTGAIFLLKTKHKYIETEKQILAGDKTEPINITITEDAPKNE